MATDTYPQSVPKTAWYIHLESGIIHAESIVPPIPSLSRGSTGTFSFRMFTTHYAGTDPPRPPTHRDRYEHLLALDEHAGSFVAERTPTNDILYQEQIPADAHSLLIKLEPAYETGVRGVWGLLDGLTDETTMETELVHVNIDIYKLADGDAYDDREALIADLEDGGP